MKSILDRTTKNLVNKSSYSYNEVLEESLKYFDGDELAATTWMKKYAIKNADDSFLECSPADMHRRMAKEFARIEKKYDHHKKDSQHKYLSAYGKRRVNLTEDLIFNYFKQFSYIVPQGSVMSSLGNHKAIASLSNCIVLPKIYDSYGGIFYTDQQMAQLFKRRCGVGIDLSTLRPSKAAVSNSARTSTGPVSFMHRFSNTTREVSQNGRRGALMLTMDIAHPDVEEFVTIKQDLAKVTGANISVRISDEFMHAVNSNKNFTQHWPIDSNSPAVVKEINARKLWNTIIKCAHRTAEPGIIFWDRQHTYSTSSVYPEFKNVSTNPCSEIAMQGGDSCRLVAINLFTFVENPFTEKATFNYDLFYEITYEAQRLMDDLVDLEMEATERIIRKVESDPEPEYVKQVELYTWKLLYENGKKGRRTGLGFTALADTFAALNMTYDSDEALTEVEHIMHEKCRAEFDSSIDLAIERGKFEAFSVDVENNSEFVLMLKKEMPSVYKRMMKHGRRNISISTVAPTGTLSILTRTSSGIEPLFMTSYTRRRKTDTNAPNSKVDFVDDMKDAWEEFTVYHPKLKEWMRVTQKNDIKQSPYFGSTANEIKWEKRIAVQAIVQKYTTHSISSTINLPSTVSEEQVDDIYMQAWKKGLKGITVYREGSRSGVLIAESKPEEKATRYDVNRPPERPAILEAEVVRFLNHDQKWIAVVGLLNNKPYEIFTGLIEDSLILPQWVNKGWVLKQKNGQGTSRYDFHYIDRENYRITMEGLSRSFNPEYWNYAKLISGVMRHGMPLPFVVDLIEKLNLESETINTWKAGVVRALKKYITNGTAAADHLCIACGDPNGLIYQEGCLTCKSCGNSKCG